MSRSNESTHASAVDVFAIAAWCGTIFGILEGAVIAYTRKFPAINAPYKTSPGVLWVAPVLNVLLFLALACVLLLASQALARGRQRRDDAASVVAVFAFLGLFGVLFAPRIIHPVSVVLFATGAATVVFRAVRKTPSIISRLTRAAPLLPVVLLSVFLLTSAALRLEDIRMRSDKAVDGAVNVLLIVLDTVRRDHFLWAGDSSYTPNIDRITARGVRYDDAWSTTSWSLPSQASILTGAFPHEHGADWPGLKLNPDVETLPEYFSARGYDTGAFSSNSAWITPEYIGRGFAHFDAYTLEDHLRRTAYGRVLSRVSIQFGFHYAGRGRKSAALNAALLDYLGENRLRPYFAYVCYMDANRAFHNKQLNRPFWRLRPPVHEQVAAYRAGLRQLDADVGRLFGELERRGLLRNTLVIITSDHGESFGPANGDRYPPGHGTSLFPAQSRVPLYIVDYRGQLEPHAVTRTVSIRQIPATVTALLGDRASPFGGDPLPGLASRPENDSADDAVLATLHYDDRNHIAIAKHGWEYIRERDDSGSRERLIAVPAKKGDSTDLFVSSPRVDTMKADLTRLRASRYNRGSKEPR